MYQIPDTVKFFLLVISPARQP